MRSASVTAAMTPSDALHTASSSSTKSSAPSSTHSSKQAEPLAPSRWRTNAGTPRLQLRQRQVLQHQPPFSIVVAVRKAKLALWAAARLRLRVLLVPRSRGVDGGRSGGGGGWSKRAGRSGLQREIIWCSELISGATQRPARRLCQGHSLLCSGAGWAASW